MLDFKELIFEDWYQKDILGELSQVDGTKSVKSNPNI